MKKISLSILSVLIICSCTKDSVKTNVLKNKLKSTMAYYNSNNDPTPKMCCFTGNIVSGHFKDPANHDWTLVCDGDNSKREFDCNETRLPNGDIIWQMARPSYPKNANDIITNVAVLDDKFILLRIADFGSTEQELNFNNLEKFSILSNMFFEVDGLTEIDGKKIILKKGDYPIFKSDNEEFKNIIKLEYELQN